ncbi:FtsX-like permease family protein [Amycolatopsis acidicola]|uniref:FtsX-like permease family protein n=1 Tax=Amycolatopsis acidicola TaxID=2596893 RepID=A0A5N0US83_9PSEU|nr:FtsX-like permease family protein [Amycolatopsis acidicola]KAA9151682.1 FtsX-like permease family protein [Amycolatopsis acidicola]
MFGLSLSTFRERWQLFLGAILTVVIGVALVQSSLLILISAAVPEIPAGLSEAAANRLRDGYTGAIVLLAMTLGIAAFLAVFIVSSTFAFTISQRRRDLALLRLVGGSRGQLRRLLLSEALLLGVLGTGIGVPAGLVVMRVQSWLLTDLGFLPDVFAPRWQDWILGVSAGVGIGVALLGVLSASRRASKVRPLEALRDTGAAARVMTFSRWFFGILFLAGTAALLIVAPLAGPDGAIPMSINAAITASIGLTALSPLIVPLVGRVLGLVLRPSTLGGLAQANLRDGVRRSASTAAPLLVLVALVLGMSGSLATISLADKEDLARTVTADLVVPSAGATAPGVAVASTEVTVPVVATISKHDKEKDDGTDALVIDADAYRQLHSRAPLSGSLADLHGMTVATTDYAVGDTITLRVGDQEQERRVVAVVAQAVNGGTDYLLPRDSVPPAALADGEAETFVKAAPGVDPATLRAALPGALPVHDWIERRASAHDSMNSGIMTVLMGLAGLYALMAVVNAVVIAAAARKAEFAAARVTGLTRRQVVGAALIESWAVAVIGLLLGGVAAAGTLTGIGAAMGKLTGVTVYAVPWSALGLVVLGAFAVVGLTSVATSLAATRPAPVSPVGARE